MGLLEKASRRSAELAGQMEGNQALTQKKAQALSYPELVPALTAVNDSFLGSRLILEILSSSSLDWIAYYQRLGDSYIACSSSGVTGSLPPINNKVMQESFSAGFIYFMDNKSKILQLSDGHVLLLPESSHIPSEIIAEIHRIFSSTIFSQGKFRLYPYNQINENSVQELLHLGLSRNYLYGSFFILNTDIVTNNAVVLCPHALPYIISNELRSIVLGILGSSGYALGMKNNACLCVFYSHTLVDTELIATQISRTFIHSIPIMDKSISLIGPWFSTKLSDEQSESGLSLFIDRVTARLQI